MRNLDKWLMRGKDIVLLLGILGPVALFFMSYYELPSKVDKQERDIIVSKVQIAELHDYTLRTDGRLKNIELQGEYNKSGIDRIESWLKNISKKIS